MTCSARGCIMNTPKPSKTLPKQNDVLVLPLAIPRQRQVNRGEEPGNE